MQPLSAQDWHSLIAQVPNTAENQALLTQLDSLASQAAVFRIPWWYNMIFLAVPTAGGISPQGNFNVDSSAPFLITHTMMHTDIAGAAVTNTTQNLPNATIVLTATGSNQQFMDVATPLGSLFGTAQWPYFWAESRLMGANSQLSATITSQEAVNTPNIRLTFGGYRLYTSQ